MKPWYKSTTLWIGVLQLIAAIAAYAAQFLQEHEPISDQATILLFINGLVMIVLRFLTDRPITAPAEVLDNLRPAIKANVKARRYMQ